MGQMKWTRKEKEARRNEEDEKYVMQLKRLACSIFFWIEFYNQARCVPLIFQHTPPHFDFLYHLSAFLGKVLLWYRIFVLKAVALKLMLLSCFC